MNNVFALEPSCFGHLCCARGYHDLLLKDAIGLLLDTLATPAEDARGHSAMELQEVVSWANYGVRCLICNVTMTN